MGINRPDHCRIEFSREVKTFAKETNQRYRQDKLLQMREESVAEQGDRGRAGCCVTPKAGRVGNGQKQNASLI